jgi:hypothetical protein
MSYINQNWGISEHYCYKMRGKHQGNKATKRRNEALEWESNSIQINTMNTYTHVFQKQRYLNKNNSKTLKE